MLADPQRFAPEAADLIVRARRARSPEALVIALRAYAWTQRWRLAEAEAKQLLDEACRIARHNGLHEALADVLMLRAAVNQELGRLAAAGRDLDAAADFAAADRRTELAFQRAVLAQNIGRLGDAAAIYHALLASPDSSLRTQVRAGNNLGLIEAQHGRYAEAGRRLEWAARQAGAEGPAMVAQVVQSLAWVTVQSGRLAEGMRRFTEAAQAYESAQLPLGEYYVEYADALIDLRLIPEATDAARAAEEEF
ncbi:MAG TPA: hypothetical protein VJT31_22485, partial [Rugosimonospora sp.]|nr:hypothetical protein [Rugosimonospora sp.]